MASFSIQNLDATDAVKLWFGLVPVDPLDLEAGFLPEDKATWDGGELASAVTTISTYGLNINAGQYYEPLIPSSAQLYSYVAVGTIIAHIKEG